MVKNLEQLFSHHKIDSAKPGFYDDPAFMAAEKDDPLFLENYARFVDTRTFSPEYLTLAKVEIPLIASICQQELVADGRLGACIDIGMILSRILEHEGFWNYQVKGSVTVKFPQTSGIGNRYFWSYDVIPHGQQSFAAAHSWIVTPPFTVVDVAIRQQPYKRGRELLPDMVLSDNATGAKVTIDDVFSPDIIAFARAKQVPKSKIARTYAPHWLQFSQDFPGTEVTIGEIRLVYIPVAIGAPDLPFEKMNGAHFNGRLGIEIYNDLVVPALSDHRRNAR